jgi:hypothetical protein
MLDAFIALLIVLAFVSTLSSYTRDYSYVQDEALYSQGRNIMDVLLYTTINTKDRGEIPLIHALKLSEGKTYWNDNIKDLIPENLNYTIEYYDGSNGEWVSFHSTYNTLIDDYDYKKSIAVISSIPIVTRNEQYKAPYTFPGSKDNKCAEGTFFRTSELGEDENGEESSIDKYENVCGIWETVYYPDEFNADSSIDYDELMIGDLDSGWVDTENYHSTFVRVVVKI